MNAFVHVSLPDDVLVDIEENKLKCDDCGRLYYQEEIVDKERGIYIEPFLPEDEHCTDCGSTNIVDGSDPHKFEQELISYKQIKENLLGFYDNYVSIY